MTIEKKLKDWGAAIAATAIYVWDSRKKLKYWGAAIAATAIDVVRYGAIGLASLVALYGINHFVMQLLAGAAMLLGPWVYAGAFIGAAAFTLNVVGKVLNGIQGLRTPGDNTNIEALKREGGLCIKRSENGQTKYTCVLSFDHEGAFEGPQTLKLWLRHVPHPDDSEDNVLDDVLRAHPNYAKTGITQDQILADYIEARKEIKNEAGENGQPYQYQGLALGSPFNPLSVRGQKAYLTVAGVVGIAFIPAIVSTVGWQVFGVVPAVVMGVNTAISRVKGINNAPLLKERMKGFVPTIQSQVSPLAAGAAPAPPTAVQQQQATSPSTSRPVSLASSHESSHASSSSKKKL